MAGALPLCELQSAQPDEHFPSKQGKKFCRLFFQACSDFSLSMTSDFATRSTGVVILTARFPHDCKPPALAGLLTSGCEGKARGTSHSPSPQPPACPGLIQAQLEASAAFPLTSLPKYSLPLFLQEGKERRIKDWIHRRTEGKIHVLGCHKMHPKAWRWLWDAWRPPAPCFTSSLPPETALCTEGKGFQDWSSPSPIPTQLLHLR